MRPVLKDPMVQAAREAFEAEWKRIGSPQPHEHHPQRGELEAARRVYHAVIDAAEAKWTAADQRKPRLVA